MRRTIVAALCLALAGCAQYESGRGNPIIRTSYDATDSMLKDMKQPLHNDAPIIVASFVELDHLDESSTLGRMLAEQVSARMTQKGFQVQEIRLRNNILVKEGTGELLLSRELKDLSESQKVQAVIVGTYVTTPNRVFLNIKLVRPMDNRILSAHDVALEADDNVQALLMAPMH